MCMRAVIADKLMMFWRSRIAVCGIRWRWMCAPRSFAVPSVDVCCPKEVFTSRTHVHFSPEKTLALGNIQISKRQVRTSWKKNTKMSAHIKISLRQDFAFGAQLSSRELFPAYFHPSKELVWTHIDGCMLQTESTVTIVWRIWRQPFWCASSP